MTQSGICNSCDIFCTSTKLKIYLVVREEKINICCSCGNKADGWVRCNHCNCHHIHRNHNKDGDAGIICLCENQYFHLIHHHHRLFFESWEGRGLGVVPGQFSVNISQILAAGNTGYSGEQIWGRCAKEYINRTRSKKEMIFFDSMLHVLQICWLFN